MKRLISLLLSAVFVFVTAFPVFGETETTVENPETTAEQDNRPDKVTDLEAYQTTEDSITMHWKKVDGADAYAVYKWSEKENKYELLDIKEETKYKASKLDPGSTYKFVVRSVKYTEDGVFYSKKSEELQAVTSPEKVSGVYTSDIETDSITLSWTATPGAVTYETWLYNKEESKFVLFGITESNEIKVDGLSENTLFSFRIRAVRSIENAAAYGKFSEIFSDFTDTTGVPRTKAQAAKLYNTRLNLLKEEKDIKISYKKTVEPETKSCSKSSLLRTIKNMMNLFAGKLEAVYQFKNGESEGVTVDSLVQPTNKNSTLRAKDILKFSSKAEDETYTLKIVLKKDEILYNGNTKSEPLPSHSKRVVTPPKIKKHKTMPIVVKGAIEKFEGTTVTMKLTQDGKVRSLKIVCPVEINAECSVSTIDFNTVVGYTMTESYSVKYNN